MFLPNPYTVTVPNLSSATRQLGVTFLHAPKMYRTSFEAEVIGGAFSGMETEAILKLLHFYDEVFLGGH